ncbi:MAG: NAD(P)-dependent oxidoreductase [Caulobacterales bacterium]
MIDLHNKKILVTGFTGRLGGAFAEELAKNNNVVGVTLAASDDELVSWRKRGVEPYVMDLADSDYGTLPKDFDYVVHTAADVAPKSFSLGMRANAEAPAMLMKHTRSAAAFLHVSTTGVYAPHSDPWHRAVETDFIGGSTLMGHYTGTKAAGEGAVSAMARILNLPTVVCRMDVQYGTYSNGGLPVGFLTALINGAPIPLPKTYDFVKALVHQDDLVSFIAPCLGAASVPVTTVNWSGDEQLKAEVWIEYLGELVGKKPIYLYDDARALPNGAASAEFRKTITGPAKVNWRDGLRRIVEFWEPRLRDNATR